MGRKRIDHQWRVERFNQKNGTNYTNIVDLVKDLNKNHHYTLQDIADSIDLNIFSLYSVLKKLKSGIKSVCSRNYSREKHEKALNMGFKNHEDAAIQLYRQGYSSSQVGDILEVTDTTIIRMLRKNSEPIRARGGDVRRHRR